MQDRRLAAHHCKTVRINTLGRRTPIAGLRPLAGPSAFFRFTGKTHRGKAPTFAPGTWHGWADTPGGLRRGDRAFSDSFVPIARLSRFRAPPTWHQVTGFVPRTTQPVIRITGRQVLTRIRHAGASPIPFPVWAGRYHKQRPACRHVSRYGESENHGDHVFRPIKCPTGPSASKA